MDFKRVYLFELLIAAGSDYHDPGVGFLKELKSGELVFSKEPRFADKKDRVLRIRVETKGGIETSYAGPRDFTDNGFSDVEVELIKARDSLFDEELYHELTKEARVMSNSGVVITETDIEVPLAHGSRVLIDLVISSFVCSSRSTRKVLQKHPLRPLQPESASHCIFCFRMPTISTSKSVKKSPNH